MYWCWKDKRRKTETHTLTLVAFIYLFKPCILNFRRTPCYRFENQVKDCYIIEKVQRCVVSFWKKRQVTNDMRMANDVHDGNNWSTTWTIMKMFQDHYFKFRSISFDICKTFSCSKEWTDRKLPALWRQFLHLVNLSIFFFYVVNLYLIFEVHRSCSSSQSFAM